MIKKLTTLFHTIRHLKWTQIKYQFQYRFQKVKPFSTYKAPFSGEVTPLCFKKDPPVYPAYLGKNRFTFLNKEKQFSEKIDWNFKEYGALWQYNLQYGNYWLEKDSESEERYGLLKELYRALADGELGLEPYPASLRIMNVVRFYQEYPIEDRALLHEIHTEFRFLTHRLEYHLLANHLLENLFALCMGSAFFGEKEWHQKSIQLLYKQLDEQILPDGAHFELSPMYHQIMLFRVLELIDWYSTYPAKDERFLEFLKEKAALMGSWLETITFENGDIPLFNDAAKGVAFSTSFLKKYAAELSIHPLQKKLTSSGYRSYRLPAYEIKIDAAQIGASYQPGHAHADALSFILYHRQQPVFVEQGTSTYDIGAQRDLERSTQAHNTVTVQDQNQSDVWSGFRVGKRAQTEILEASDHFLKAQHDGYQRLGCLHIRSFEVLPERLVITDKLQPSGKGVAYFHLHPDCQLEKIKDTTYKINKELEIDFEKAQAVLLEEYAYSDTYYQYTKAQRIVVSFETDLKTSVYFRGL